MKEIPDIWTTLPQRLKAQRGNRGLRAAAKEIGIGHATLGLAERGHTVSYNTLRRLFDWLHLRVVED